MSRLEHTIITLDRIDYDVIDHVLPAHSIEPDCVDARVQ